MAFTPVAAIASDEIFQLTARQPWETASQGRRAGGRAEFVQDVEDRAAIAREERNVGRPSTWWGSQVIAKRTRAKNTVRALLRSTGITPLTHLDQEDRAGGLI